MQPARVEQLVRPVLEPGEEILWMGASSPWRASPWGAPLALLTLAYWPVMVILFCRSAPLHALLFLLSWVLLCRIAKRAVPHVRAFGYAITDRRALILRGGWQLLLQSYRFVDPERIRRVERRNGWGDILIGSQLSPDGRPQPAGFFCVPDAGRVESILCRMAQGTNAGPAVALHQTGAEDAATREKGFAALARMGASADAVLARALADADPCVREAAARAAGRLAKDRLPDGPVLVALAGCLEDPYAPVRGATRQSLEAIAADGLVPLIRAVTAAGGDTPEARVANVLGGLSAGAIARGALDALRENDRDFGRILHEHLVDRPLLRNWIIRAWAEPALTRTEEILPLLEDRPLWARLWIAQALGSAGVTSARRRLAELLGSTDGETSLVGAVGLGTMGDPRAVDRLVAALESDDREVRLSAAVALSHLGALAGAALEPLRKLLHQEADPYVSEAYQTALNRITFALRRQPTELQAAEAPAGRGTEPEAVELPEGTGTEPTWSADAERHRTP